MSPGLNDFQFALRQALAERLSHRFLGLVHFGRRRRARQHMHRPHLACSASAKGARQVRRQFGVRPGLVGEQDLRESAPASVPR